MIYPYKIYLPSHYTDSADQSWPLIIFLHGAGERGNNLEIVKSQGLPKYLQDKTDFPFIIVYPQCPAHNYWEISRLNQLFEEIIADLKVDHSRIYLTGISMGGYGTWHWAAKHPEKFAAIIPICGGGDIREAYRLVDVPVWAFHGAKDDIVPLLETLKMTEAVKKAGGNPKLTIYPDLYHDSWTKTYNNYEIYDWLLQYRNEF